MELRSQISITNAYFVCCVKQTRPKKKKTAEEIRPALPATRQHTPTNVAWETRLKLAPFLPLY